MNEKDASILAQVAAKVAGQLCMGTNDLTSYLEAVAVIHDDLLTRYTEGATADVAAAFPGAQAVYQGPQVPPAGVFPQGTVTVAPEAITDEAAWADVFTNPNNWFNNTTDQERSTIVGGKGPDFRAKNTGPKDGKGKAKALWLYSQYGDAPLWVFQKLGLQPRGTVAPAAPAGGPVVPGPVSKTTGQPLTEPF